VPTLGSFTKRSERSATQSIDPVGQDGDKKNRPAEYFPRAEFNQLSNVLVLLSRRRRTSRGAVRRARAVLRLVWIGVLALGTLVLLLGLPLIFVLTLLYIAALVGVLRLLLIGVAVLVRILAVSIMGHSSG